MDPIEFLQGLDQQLTALDAQPIEGPEMQPDPINREKWPETAGDSRTFVVESGGRWIAIRRYLAESGQEKKAFLLVSAPASSADTVALYAVMTIRSDNTTEGVVAGMPHLRKHLKQTLTDRLAALGALPRYEGKKLYIGPLDGQFIPRLFIAVTELLKVKSEDKKASGSAVESGAPIRYWAGAIGWCDDKLRQEFLAKSRWELGAFEEKQQKEQERCRELFSQIEAGDRFAMKTYEGATRLNIWLIGEVAEVDVDAFSLELAQVSRRELQIAAPPDKKWHERLNEITSEAGIAAIFGDESDVHQAPLRAPADLNTILYGPPGTGKTYETIERAVQIVDGTCALPREDVQQRFKTLQKEGRVAFVTFHQSFSYEDFIEGIRPSLIGDEGQAGYRLHNGVFKTLALKAAYACLKPISAVTDDFDARWGALIRQIESEPEREYQGLSAASRYELTVSRQGNIVARNIKSGAKSEYLCPRAWMRKVFEHYRTQQTITTKDVSDVLGSCHAHVIAMIYRELRQKPASSTGVTPLTTEQQVQVVLDYLREGEASGYRWAFDACTPRFVLIIDEINRGNISRIFGELISLLEPEKRLGQPVEITVALPSGEPFAVPPNLHLIGTMNSADKSLALLDVALRRRFRFKELPPKLPICANLSDLQRNVLAELNQRIAMRKGRDFQIGHAFFLGVKNDDGFEEVFEHSVIPLLQEYFHGDWEGLRYVLQDEKNQHFIRPVQNGSNKAARYPWQWHRDVADQIDMISQASCLDALVKNYQLNGSQTHESN